MSTNLASRPINEFSSPYTADQMAGRMELTASGRPATMRRSVRKRLARALTTYSWAHP